LTGNEVGVPSGNAGAAKEADGAAPFDLPTKFESDCDVDDCPVSPSRSPSSAALTFPNEFVTGGKDVVGLSTGLRCVADEGSRINWGGI
jgi:hypothetical protein